MSRRRALVVVGAVLAGAVLSAQSPAECSSCVEARYWEISPTFWNDTTPAETAPEREKLVGLRKFDVGVAFSGGGTRSASATLGQLRGLEQNGWLARVRYMTAVSGGSWAAVPFTYAQNLSLNELLGEPKALDAKTIETVPSGLLAERIVQLGSRSRGRGRGTKLSARHDCRTRPGADEATPADGALGYPKVSKPGCARSPTGRTRPTRTCSARSF